MNNSTDRANGSDWMARTTRVVAWILFASVPLGICFVILTLVVCSYRLGGDVGKHKGPGITPAQKQAPAGQARP